MTGIPVLHELEQVILSVEVDGLGYLGRVAIDMKMLFNLVDDGSGEQLVFDIDLVFPGGAGEYNWLILSD
jgi:hypothetical protein